MNPSSIALMIRHFWQGGYSLGASFWMIGILGSLLITTAIAGLLSLPDEPPLPLVLAMGALGALYNGWIVVGIWRSAGKYQGPTGYAHAARTFIVMYAIYSLATLALILFMLMLGGAVMLNPPFIK